MALLCYHASHEQFAPSRLLKLAVAAEQAGFTGLHSSDHFQPWSARQGHSGFSFAWVAAAMQATTLPMSMVCAPGQRYHPAIIAQAIATLGEMFPGRFAMELGTGEALNECMTGEGWPDKDAREARLLEAVTVIRRLLLGEQVSCDGFIQVKNARLWTLPPEAPPLLGAAVSEPSARWVAGWADGLLTTVDRNIAAAMRKVRVFREHGGEPRHIHLQYAFSYARSERVAIDEAWDQWQGHFATDNCEDIATPEEFDQLAQRNQAQAKKRMNDTMAVFTDAAALLEQVSKLEETGASRIILHNLSGRQEDFIEDFGRALAAAKRSTAPRTESSAEAHSDTIE